MQNFTVDKNVQVHMRSSRDAVYDQRFTIERESPLHPGFWEGMGKKTYSGGEGGTFVPFSARTTWRISCEHDNGGWIPSREQISGAGTNLIVINCDDDFSGDNDFNDLIVEFAMGGSFKDGKPATGPEYTGDGKYKPDPEPPTDPDPGKHKIPH